MSFDPYGDCCIHPLAIVSHSFSSASKWQLLRTTHQPTRSPPSLSNLHPLPLFPIFLSRSAFLRLPFHNNKISDRWRWIKSVLFTPLDDDGKGSVGLMPFEGISSCPLLVLAGSVMQKLVPLGVAPAADGCREAYRDTSLTRSLSHNSTPYGYCIIQSGGVVSKKQLVFFSRSLSPSRLILVVFLKGAFNDKYHMAVGTGAFISVQKRSCNNVH